MSLIRDIILDKLPYVGRLRRQLRGTGQYPAGHYYSPLPERREMLTQLVAANADRTEPPDIDFNRPKQFELLTAFQALYRDLPFPEEKNDDCRYYYNQLVFCYADAIFLYSFLRHFQPKRIIEVGSGFSSAVILDTVEKFFPKQPEITFIDPEPERFQEVVKSYRENVPIITKKVQDISIATFDALTAGDLLFIDSSHVVKCGSDLQFLMFEVMPRLPAGTFVHFHDIFYPFEYPVEWLLNGRYWNEIYFIRAFLSFNSAWEIVFFNSYVAATFEKFLSANMPLCLKSTGGSLYLRKTGKT